MSVVEKQWNRIAPGTEAVQLNTLTLHENDAYMPFSGPARIGVILATLPKLSGQVNIKTSVRDGNGDWKERWFVSKSKSIAVIDGERRKRILATYMAETVETQLKALGKGHSGQIGADPEIFAVNAKNEIMPAGDYLPAKTENTQIFWDGIQGEFTTKTETCLAWFIDQVHHGLLHVHQAVKAKDGKLLLADVVEVPMTMLQSLPWEQVRLGCDPSHNAYNDAGNLDVDAKLLQLRFAGAHKHFGINDLTQDMAIPIVKALDAIWGVASVSMFDGFENPLRRMYYGRAGEYRLPKHGLEYRTPSNAWLCHPAIAHISWTLARQAVRIGHLNLLGAWNANENEVRRVINELDVVGARKILKKNKAILQMLMESYFASNHGRDKAERFEELAPLAIKHGVRVIMEGAFGVLAAPKDLVKNWMLDAPTSEDVWENPGDEHRNENKWFLHSESGDKQWIHAAEVIERGEQI